MTGGFPDSPSASFVSRFLILIIRATFSRIHRPVVVDVVAEDAERRLLENRVQLLRV